MRIFFKHPSQQTQRLRIHFLILFSLKRNVARSVLGKHLVISLSRKCTDSQEQNMENQPQTEDITDRVVFSLHIFDVNNLRSDIPRSTASHKEILISLRKLSQTKVSNRTLEGPLGSEYYILRFEVPVHHLFAVHLLESIQNGVYYNLYLMGLELVFSLDFIVELTPLKKLHHHIKRILRLINLKQPHTVLMLQRSHHLYLFYQTFLSLILTVCCLLRKSLHSIVFFIFQLLRQINRRKVSLTNFLLRLELLMETSLVNLSLQHLSPLMKVADRPQGIGCFLITLFEGNCGRRLMESKFEIKVENNV